MNRAVGFIVAAVIAGGGSGCGDDLEPPGLSPPQLLEKLRALPGVTVDEASTEQDGLAYFVLHFTQPIDHDDPTQGTFQQEVSLLHRSERAPVPMIVHTSGYWDNYRDTPVELTRILGANQVSIEHRYYGTSRPVPTDWSKLTIAQMAADEHAIITALRTVYDGAFLSTGGSKGGMTAIFHRRFYPDDVDGTVAYVAPLSFGAPDPRYPAFFDTIGASECRDAVRNVAIEMLAHRRDAMEARAGLQRDHVYRRVAIGPAVESAIAGLEWAFWQYSGVSYCATVPAVTASDDELFGFLDQVSPVWECADDMIGQLEPYYYESYAQLGYPDDSTAYLAPYRIYGDGDFDGELPTTEPEYDSAAMRDIDDFVEHHGDRLMFIYGEWDPWTEGRFVLGDATNSASFLQPRGTHSSQIAQLLHPDRDAALSMLKDWTGVTPELSRQRRASGTAEPPPPRMAPVRVRAPAARR